MGSLPAGRGITREAGGAGGRTHEVLGKSSAGRDLKKKSSNRPPMITTSIHPSARFRALRAVRPISAAADTVEGLTFSGLGRALIPQYGVS